jgi:hypothetical protein
MMKYEFGCLENVVDPRKHSLEMTQCHETFLDWVVRQHDEKKNYVHQLPCQ